MIFVKQTNGNVKVTTNGGDTILLIQDTGVQISVIGASSDAILIRQFGYPIYSCAAADVSATQIVPAAPVVFAGNAYDLLDLLSDNFFLINTAVIITGTVTSSDEGIANAKNSTNVALLAAATFTGTSIDVSKYPSVVVAVLTDQIGALQVQFSPDNVNWDSTLSYSVAASINEVHRITVTRKYYRVQFINGAVNQGFLRLQTLLGGQQTLSSALNSTIKTDADTIIVRPLDFNLMVSEGLYQNRNATTKEGINFDVDTATVPEDLWDFGGVYTGFVSAPAAAEINVPGADTGTIFYSYMATATDTNYTFASRAISGAENYALGHNIYRCNSCYFVAANGVSFNVSQIIIRAVATPANVFVSIPIGYSQSYCAAYTVPFGATAFIDRITSSVRFNMTGFCDGVFWYRPIGESPRYRFTHEYNSNSLYFDDIDYLVAIPQLTDFIPRIIFSSANNLVCKIAYRLILKRS